MCCEVFAFLAGKTKLSTELEFNISNSKLIPLVWLSNSILLFVESLSELMVLIAVRTKASKPTTAFERALSTLKTPTLGIKQEAYKESVYMY